MESEVSNCFESEIFDLTFFAVGRLRGDVARESDERISNLEEMINSISVVKMY